MEQEVMQEKNHIDETTTDRKNKRGFASFWNKYYVYIVSSLLVVVAVTVVLAAKKFWPFGNGILLNGDFVLQGWPFVEEFKRKLMTGDSWFYTWNAGYGTNFYSILSYGMFNPSTLIFMLVPDKFVFQTSTVLFVVNLLCMNASMLYFLTHRPGLHLEQNKIANMLFSLSYTLCIYVVSNINNWTFLIVAALFPLIILGLENFVANKGWKLYFITLTLAFFMNYYYTGLFCIFIVLYYLTLEFESFRYFVRKSWKIMLLSIVAILTSGVALVPTFLQMTAQSYTKSELRGGIWFTTIYDQLKSFLALNRAVDRGSAYDSYGEVDLYYGLLMLMLTSFFFLNKKIKLNVRIRKLLVFILYLAAFNTNYLNYTMHLFHYPTWFPNRFALFFTLFCIILAYESWVSMEHEKYKNINIAKVVVIGFGWSGIAVLCFLMAKHVQYEFTYYYSIMIFMFYMVAILLLAVFKGKWARILAVIGCVELMLNFDYAFIYRGSVQVASDVPQTAEKETQLIRNTELAESNGFSRMLAAGDIISGSNGGMLYNAKSATIFASSMNNVQNYLIDFGIIGGGNNSKAYTYTPATMSCMNVEYILLDRRVVDNRVPNELYSTKENLFEQYELVTEEDDAFIYRNPTVLSLGYMIPQEAKEYYEILTNGEQTIDYSVHINQWMEAVSGISDIMIPVEMNIENIETLNCEAAIVDNSFYITQHLEQKDIDNFNENGTEVFVKNELEEYDTETESVIRLDCTMEEAGDYYIEIGEQFAAVGYMEKGEKVYIYYEGNKDVLNKDLGLNGVIQLYRFDEQQWKKAYHILSQEQMQVTGYSSTEITGSIETENGGIMFTSVPYDNNWVAYVDGVETEIIPLWNDTFVALDLEPGVHEIRLEYHQKGVVTGVVVSLLSIGMFAMLIIMERRKKLQILEESRPSTVKNEQILANCESAETESAETESAETKSADTESTDTESTDTGKNE